MPLMKREGFPLLRTRPKRQFLAPNIELSSIIWTRRFLSIYEYPARGHKFKMLFITLSCLFMPIAIAVAIIVNLSSAVWLDLRIYHVYLTAQVWNAKR